MSLVNYAISDGSEEEAEESEEATETAASVKAESKPEFSLPTSIRRRSNIIAVVNSTPEITLKVSYMATRAIFMT